MRKAKGDSGVVDVGAKGDPAHAVDERNTMRESAMLAYLVGAAAYDVPHLQPLTPELARL